MLREFEEGSDPISRRGAPEATPRIPL